MNEQAQREQLRLSLLRYLDRDGSAMFGLPTKRLQVNARSEGFTVTYDIVEAELIYLQDKGLVAEISKTLSPEVRAWRVTAQGRDLLAQQGE
jgi:hypothetical protein